MKTLATILILAVTLLSAQENLQAGLSAYQKGDYRRALQILQPLAYQADARAMMYLGRMYELGQGVAKDEQEAFAWYFLSMEEGNSDVEEQYLMPLEERLGDRLYQAMDRAEALREKVAAAVRSGNNFPPPQNQTAANNDFVRPTPSASPQGRADAGQWVSENSGTVSLRHPAGWRMLPPGDDGQIRLSSPSNETLVLWPFYLQQQMTPAGAATLLQRFAAMLNPGFRWNRTESVGRQALRCWGQEAGLTAVTGMNYAAGNGRSAGYVYYLAAPDQQFRQNQALYVNLLKTVNLRGSGQGGAAGGGQISGGAMPRIQYQRWQDPAEQAFSLDVPAGWQVQGGLLRRAAVDVTKSVWATSPDGQIVLFMGDPNIPVFTIPNETLAMTGFQEGSWYSPGYGTRMMVMRFKPGAYFAGEYVQNSFGRRCGALQITGSRDRPDASQQINQILQQSSLPGFQQQLSTGEVRFSCMGNGGAQVGYCFAGTQAVAAYGSGIWTVEYLFGYIAPQQRAAEAETILAHMASTIALNPAWAQMQQGITGNVSQIVTQTGNYISSLISSSYAAQQASQDESARRFSNYIRGTEDVVDPNSGETYKVESSSNYYWISPGGTIVGTDLSANPDPLRFEEMIRLP